MWTIYDIYKDRYWNEELLSWCTADQATLYSAHERDHLPLRSVGHQWKFILPDLHGSSSALVMRSNHQALSAL